MEFQTKTGEAFDLNVEKSGTEVKIFYISHANVVLLCETTNLPLLKAQSMAVLKLRRAVLLKSMLL